MNDRKFLEQKKRVQKYIDKWYKTLGLEWFQVDMIWNRERDREEPATAATTTSRWQYRSADIVWFLPVLAEINDDKLENVVVHEFVHILVAPMMLVRNQEDLPHQHEYATENVALALIWARQAGKDDK